MTGGVGKECWGLFETVRVRKHEGGFKMLFHSGGPRDDEKGNWPDQALTLSPRRGEDGGLWWEGRAWWSPSRCRAMASRSAWKDLRGRTVHPQGQLIGELGVGVVFDVVGLGDAEVFLDLEGVAAVDDEGVAGDEGGVF